MDGPIKSELLGEKPWFKFLDDQEVARGLLSIFGVPNKKRNNNGNEDGDGDNDYQEKKKGFDRDAQLPGLRRGVFERILATVAVVKFLERQGDDDVLDEQQGDKSKRAG